MAVHKVGNSYWCTIGKTGTTSIKVAVSLGDPVAVEIDNLLKWTVARNPYSRLFSVWSSTVNRPPNPDLIMNRYIPQGSSFQKFVNMVSETPDDISELHFRSQCHVLKHNSDFQPDVVLRFESLPLEWPSFAGRIGVNPVLPAKNTTRPNCSDYDFHVDKYSDELKELVAVRYQQDFKRFGYDPERL